MFVRCYDATAAAATGRRRRAVANPPQLLNQAQDFIKSGKAQEFLASEKGQEITNKYGEQFSECPMQGGPPL